MKLYLVSKTDHDGNRLWLYFFLRSALALVARLAEVEAWKDESRPSPWKREQAGKNILWRLPDGRSVELIPIGLNFRDWSLRRWIRQRCHWQNLNTKEVGDREVSRGSILRNGRAWLHTKGHRRDLLSVEWSTFKRSHLHLSLDVFAGDNERAVMFAFGTYFLNLYLTFENVIPRRWAKNHNWSHDTGLTWIEGSLRLELYHSGNDCYYCEGYDGRPKGWTGWSKYVDFRDLLMGRNDYRSEVLETHRALVTMPEGQYPATVTINRATWTRRRWPFRLFPRVRVDSHIEVAGGIPVPGKGENSYDSDDDAINSTGSSTPTVAAAVAQMTKSALETRERYGGRNWRPAESVKV
jgi:hypothetical protein